MRQLIAMLFSVFIGCASPQSQPIIPGIPVGTQMEQRAGYIYVSLGKPPALNVYGAGCSNTPVRTVPLDGPGFAVVADKSGRVYVSELLNNEVQVFDEGAAHALGKLSGVSGPSGMFTDGNTIYVANHATGPQHDFGFVTVYASGKLNPERTITSPPGQAPVGVAVDSKGNVFEAVINGTGTGILVENGTKIANLGTATRGGLTMDGRGNVIAGNEGFLETFYAPDFTRTSSAPAPQPGILEFFTHTSMGTFIPMNVPDNGHLRASVTVVPEAGAGAPCVLYLDGENPQGATGAL